MSEAVDTRIVEAKFDSSQFEKGVDRTVKKLDELKKSMTFEQTGKSIADLTSKAQEATEKASSSLEKLEDRITSFTGMLKQKLLSGIADEIVGVFFKVENSIKSLISTLTSGQMGLGMQRYSDLLTSVRVLTMSGVDEGAAYKTMERLTDYADQTSYSLDQMVSTMSKFKTAGADLGTAERMIVGLSNAAASMGVNAQQAQRAYLNMQQAYSTGFMSQRDWISFESLPMVGEKFNQAILDAAVNIGTLKKEANGTYKTINKIDKQVRTSGSDAKGITAENLGQKLSSRWFNKQVMEEVFGQTYYFSLAEDSQINQLKDIEKQLKQQVKDGLITQDQMDKEFQKHLDEIAEERSKEKKDQLDEQLAQGKITIDQYNKAWSDFEKSNHLTKFGWDAFRAGQEARSFTDVMVMLKDVISRGWATSFEIIFGKLDEASKFFTELADNAVIRAIRAIIDFRNEVLQTWADDGGRDELMQALRTINELIGELLGKFTIFGDDEDDVTKKAHKLGDALYQSTIRFRKSVEAIRAWFNEVDPSGKSRLDRIAEAFRTIGDAVKGVSRGLTLVLGFVGELLKLLTPVFDTFWGVIQKVLDEISKLMNPVNDEKTMFGSIRNGLDNIIEIARPFIDIINKVLGVVGEVAAFFIDIATGTLSANMQFFADILGLIVEVFGGTSGQKANTGTGVIEGITNDIESFGQACKDALQFVKEFFENLFKDLRTLLGLEKKAEGEAGSTEEGGFFSNLIHFFSTNEFIKSVKDLVNKAIEDIGKFIVDIPNKIVKLGNSIWDAITGIFWNKDYSEKTYQNIKRFSTVDAEKYKEGMKTPFLKFVENIGKTIKDFFVSLPDRIVAFVGNVGDFITTAVNAVFDFFLGEKKTETASDENGKLIETTTRDKMNSGYENLKTAIVDFVRSIPGKIMSVLNGLWKTVSGVAGKIWNFVDELLFGKKVKDYKWDTKNKKMVWVTRRIKTGFSKWLDDTIISIKNFFTNPEKIKAIWDTIVDFFFGRKATDADLNKINPKTGETYKITDRVKEGFSEWLDNTITTVLDWIRSIPEKISQIWNTIIDFIFGREATEADTKTINPVTGKNYKPTERVKEGFSLWIHNVWTNVKTWFTSGQILKDLEGIWNTVIDFIFGKEGTITVKDPDTGEETQMTVRVKEGFSKWLDDTVKTVGDWIRGIPEAIRNLWNTVLNAIFGTKEANGFSQEIYDKLLNYDSASANKYKEYYTKKSGIVAQADEFLKGIGINIGELIGNLPTYIAQGFDFSVDLFGDLLGKIDMFFKKKNNPEEYKKVIEQNSKDVVNAITEGTADGAKKADDGKSQSGFVEVIISIGQKIASLITTTIPSILSGAWGFISRESTNLFNAIVELFTGINWTEVGNKAAEVGDRIVEMIKSMPDAIRGAIDWIKNLFKGKNGKYSVKIEPEEFISVPNTIISGNTVATVKDGIGKGSRKLKKVFADGKAQLVEEIDDDFNLWDAVKDIGSAIGDAFVNLGPDILNGINSAITWIGNGIGKLTDWFSGFNKAKEENKDLKLTEYITGQIDENPENKEYAAIWEAAQNIGKNVFNIFTTVIPGFISEAFTTIGNAIPTFINNLFGGNSKEADSAVEETNEAVEEKMLQIEVNAKEGAQALQKSLEKTAAEAGEQSTFWTWLSKFNPMNLIISSAGAEGEEQKAEEKTNVLKTIFDNLAGVFGALTDVNTVKTGIIVAAVLGVLLALQEIVDQLAFIDDIGYVIKWTGITAAILGIVGLIGYLVYLGETGQEEKLKTIKETFEEVKGLITSFMALLTTIKSLGVVSNIAKTVGTANTIINNTGVYNNNVTKGNFRNGLGQGIGGALGKLVSAFATGGYIWLILQQLPALIESVADAKAKLKAAGADDDNIGDDMLYVMGGVAAVMASTAVIGIAMAGIQKIVPTGLDPGATLNTVLSISEIIIGAGLVITAIQGLDTLLTSVLGDGKGVYDGLKQLGETVATLLSQLGSGIGGFLYGLTHGETKDETEARKQESVEKMFNLLVEASKTMPIEQLETIVDLTEKMIGIYERLDGLGTKVENVKTIVAATDIAGTFRTISQAILEILTAFDTAETEKNKILSMAAPNTGFFGGDNNYYSVEDFADDAKTGYDLANRDYSVWKSFAEGGSAYEAIQQYINILSDVASSLSGAISPNLIDLLTKRSDQYTTFWERLNEFFRGGDGKNSGFSDVIEYVKIAYSTIEANYDALKPYTDSKYSNIIAAINNLFSIFTNLMPEGELAAKVLTQGDTSDAEGPYATWYFRIRNMLDWGPSGSKNDFEDLIQRVVKAYEVLGKYDSQLSQYKNSNFIGLIQGIYNVFGIFSDEDGVGSGTWLDNYMAFKKKLNASGFLDNYVKDIEKVFDVFKKSSLFDKETGTMGGNIYFDGVSIVKGLFDAINLGLKSDDLPELDATAVGDAILKALNISDAELKIAKKVHEMIQEGLLTFNTQPKLGSFDTSGMTSMSEAMQQLLGQTTDAENGFMSFFTSDEGITKIQGVINDLHGSMSVETLLGEDKDTYVNEMQEVIKSATMVTDPETGEQMDLLAKVEDMYSKIETILSNFSALGLTAGTNLSQGIADGITTGVAISTVQALADSIKASINDQEIKPKITPILDIDNPEFIASANRMREMLGYNPMVEVNGTLDTSLHIADSIKIPEQKDYSTQMQTIIDLLTTTSSGVDNFNNNMSQMRFTINGEEFGMLIYPFISRAAGYDSVTFARQGVDEGTE